MEASFLSERITSTLYPYPYFSLRSLQVALLVLVFNDEKNYFQVA